MFCKTKPAAPTSFNFFSICLTFSFAPSFHNLPPFFFTPHPHPQVSLCEGHAIDFPLSIHFSRLALKRGKQTKATPAPPLHPPPLPFLLALTVALSVEECHPPTTTTTTTKTTASTLLYSFSSSLPLSLSVSSTFVQFPSSQSSSPFTLDFRPHSTTGIKVMHHTKLCQCVVAMLVQIDIQISITFTASVHTETV